MPHDLVAVVRVTARCNLGCRFCAYSAGLDRPRRDADPEQLLRFGEALAGYADSRGRIAHLSWLGGEPLLWTPLRDLAERLASHAPALTLGLTTNGTPLQSPAIRDHVARCYEIVTISADGLGPWHDEVRGAKGAFARLERAVSELAARGPQLTLRVNTILMHQSVRDLPELVATVARWGVRELTFNQLGGADRPEFHPAHRLTSDDVAWLRGALPGIRADAARLGVRVLGSAAYEARIEASSNALPVAVEDCGPGTRFVFVDEDGIASPCSFTGPDYGIPLAQLDTPAAIEGLPALWRARRAQHRAAACADCLSTQVFGKFPDIGDPARPPA